MYKFVVVLFAMQMLNVFAQEYVINGKSVTREDLLDLVKDGLISRISVDTLNEKKTTETTIRPVEQPVTIKNTIETYNISFLKPSDTPSVKLVVEDISTPKVSGDQKDDSNFLEAYTDFLNFMNTPIKTPVEKDIASRFSSNQKDNEFTSTKKDTFLTIPTGSPSNGYLIDQFNSVKPKVETTRRFNTLENLPAARQNAEEDAKRAKDAQYQFGFLIDDGISGNNQQRSEVRKDGVVKGTYSYDNGYEFRTISYIADVNGFRITNEVVEPSKMKGFTGQAHVKTVMDGGILEYLIRENDITGSNKQSKMKQ